MGSEWMLCEGQRYWPSRVYATMLPAAVLAQEKGNGKKMCWGNCYITSVPPTNATGPSQGNLDGVYVKTVTKARE